VAPLENLNRTNKFFRRSHPHAAQVLEIATFGFLKPTLRNRAPPQRVRRGLGSLVLSSSFWEWEKSAVSPWRNANSENGRILRPSANHPFFGRPEFTNSCIRGKRHQGPHYTSHTHCMRLMHTRIEDQPPSNRYIALSWLTLPMRDLQAQPQN